MKTFSCTCGQLIFFQNVLCLACRKQLGFLPDSLALGTIEPATNGFFTVAQQAGGNRLYRKCQNYDQEAVCNWMIPEEETSEAFCKSCRLNQTIPDLSSGRNLALWGLAEAAKRRLVYSLLTLKLPLANKMQDPLNGLSFRFLTDIANPDGSVNRVLTGHDNGTITLNLAEADDVFRENTRLAMEEPYRTLLGHFRHEIGHYYWGRLVRNTEFMDRFRSLFGNEQVNYREALAKYYAGRAPANWPVEYISYYATAHPWEDWAETWAHFMHIHDTLEVADDFGLQGKSLHKNSERGTEQSASSLKWDTFGQMIGP